MRILVVTNLYPPDAEGGYEFGCRDVVEGLERRGHVVKVVTRRAQNGVSDVGVERVLRYRRAGDRKLLVWGPALSLLDVVSMRRIGRVFCPSVVYIWNPVGLSRAAVATASRLGPSATYVAGAWLEHAQRGTAFPDPFVHQLCRVVSMALGRAAAARLYLPLIGMSKVLAWHFDSGYLRDAVLPILPATAQTSVIHHAVPVAGLLPIGRRRTKIGGTRVLYVGRVVPKKGVDLALKALKLARAEMPATTLTVVGDGPIAYRLELEALAASLHIGECVSWLGTLSRDELVAIYEAHDVFLFLTEEEAFGIVLVEAMAAGLVVVSSGVGGTPEAAPCGHVSFCVGTEDIAVAADALIKAARAGEPVQQMVANGLRWCRNFDMGPIAKLTDSALSQIAAGTRFRS